MSREFFNSIPFLLSGAIKKIRQYEFYQQVQWEAKTEEKVWML